MKNNRVCFISINLCKLTTTLLIICAIILGTLFTFKCNDKTSSATIKNIYTVVIDAGHGGRDVGCSGSTTSVKESDINLSIAKILKEYLECQGLRVVLTRTDENGLYSDDAENFKLSDMNARVDIINKIKPNMVISIHQNSFEDESLKGAQVFYHENDASSEVLARCMQEQLKATLDYCRDNYNHSDLYLLKESNTLGVLIECGYLTNKEDELNLSSVNYQQKVAYAIMCGVVRYLICVGNINLSCN